MKRYTKSKLNKEILGGLAYRIHDTGAKGEIIVSPLGLQAGAEIVAKSENIIPIQIDPFSTRTDYFVKFMLGVSGGICITESINFELLRKCSSCGNTTFKVIENENIATNIHRNNNITKRCKGQAGSAVFRNSTLQSNSQINQSSMLQIPLAPELER